MCYFIRDTVGMAEAKRPDVEDADSILADEDEALVDFEILI